MRTDIAFGVKTERSGRILPVLAAVALLAALTYSSYQYRSLHMLEERMSNERNHFATVARRDKTPQVPVTEQRVVAATVAQLNMPFSSVLRAIVPPPDQRIALLDVSISSGTDATIKLSGEALDYRTMTDYVAWLGERPSVRSVVLLSHEIDPVTPGQPVRFQLEFKWNR